MTAPAVQIGSTAAVAQPLRYTCTASDGERITYSWRGPKAAVKTQYDSIRTGQGYETVDYMENGAEATCTATKKPDGTYSDLNVSTTTYELISQEEQVKIHNHEYFSSLTADQIAAVYKYADENPTSITAPGGWVAKQGTLLKFIQRKELYCLETRYVLRRTKTCNTLTSGSASYTGVGAVDGSPPTPAGLIGSLPSGEWLKKAPQVRQIGTMAWQNRWQIVDEWWWAKKWSLALYGGTGDP